MGARPYPQETSHVEYVHQCTSIQSWEFFHSLLYSRRRSCTCFCSFSRLPLSPSSFRLLEICGTAISREDQGQFIFYLNPTFKLYCPSTCLIPTFKFYCTSTGTGILKIYWLPPRLHYSTFTRKYVGIVRGTRTTSYELHKVYQYTVVRTRTVLRTE